MSGRAIRVRCIGDKGVLVRLPQIWWLYLAFREAFPRTWGARHAWSFFVPGPTALKRLGVFDAAHAPRVDREACARQRALEDADWDRAAIAERSVAA